MHISVIHNLISKQRTSAGKDSKTTGNHILYSKMEQIKKIPPFAMIMSA